MKKTLQGYFTLLSLLLAFIAFPVSLFAEGASNSPSVSLSPLTVSTQEGGLGTTQTLTFTLSIDVCPDVLPLEISVYTTGGTAQAASDYTQFSDTYTFSPNASCQTSRSISIDILGDDIVELDETFNLQIGNNGTHVDQSFTLGGSSTITIANDDIPNNADLSIVKTNDKGSTKVLLGDQILYTLTATNSGPQNSTIEMTDTLPSGLTFVNVSDDSGNFSCVHNAGTITCNGSRDFGVAESVTILVTANVTAYNASFSNYKYRNTASISSPAGRIDPNTANNTTFNDVLVERIDLKPTKSVADATVDINDTITFELTARNNSPQGSTISLVDILPPGMSLINANITSGPANFTCNADIVINTVTCGGTHIFTAGTVAYITVTALANTEGRHFNTVTLTSPEGYPDKAPGNDTAIKAVDIGGDGNPNVVLANMSKIVSAPTTINPDTGLLAYFVGDTVTYTVTATTSGFSSRFAINDYKSSAGTTSGALSFSNLHCASTFGTVLAIEDTLSLANNNQVNVCINSPLSEDSSAYNVPHGTTYTLTIDALLLQVGTVCNTASANKGLPKPNGTTNWNTNKVRTKCIEVIAHQQPPVLNAGNFDITPDVLITPINLQSVTTDPDTSPADLNYTNPIGLPAGLTMDASGVITGTYVHPGRGPVAGPFTVTVTVVDPQGLADTDDFTITLIPPPLSAAPNSYLVPITSIFSGNLITELTTYNGSSGPDIGVDILLIGVTEISSNPSTFQWNSDGSFTYDANTTASGTIDQYQYFIDDKYGQTDNALLSIELHVPFIDAKNDNYSAATNTPLAGNVILDDTGNGSDIGIGIHVTANTSTSNGSLTLSNDGSFTYNPDLNYTGNDSFIYKITDNFGQESNATVTIIVGAIALEGYKEFYLVNPPATRNIIGNFITIGNTIECVTDKLGDANESNSFDGTCSNISAVNNNEYMTKYIDIDGDATPAAQSTWNSSSSNFTLPLDYNSAGNGILWAGLFWQGAINNRYGATQYKQRRAFIDGGSYDHKYINSDEIIDISTTDANTVLFKIDNELNYTSIESDTIYNDIAHEVGGNNYGGYYAAYKNITTYLQSYNLTSGSHTFTVANITSNEGREKFIGNYAGWSLVVVHKEDITTGKPRNISIYNGYIAIGEGSGSNLTSGEVSISGFKLPKNGSISANISAFIGEGEKAYGGSNIVYDKMYVKDLNGTIYPIATADPNNIFDATLAGISRGPGNDNDISNTNGIDVDAYDVSDIMLTMRNGDENVSSLSLGVVSQDDNLSDGDDSDYVTPSMIAFSAELYKPEICYDYTLDIDGYVLVSENNEITTSFGDRGIPLTSRISIKSEEGDFVLRDVNISYQILNTGQVQYIADTTAIAPNGIYSYIPAGSTGLNQTYDEITSGFGMYIGQNANAVPGPGGTIDAFETRYIRFDNDLLTTDTNTSFQLDMQYLINYGSGDLELTHSFDSSKLCDSTGIYYPARGIFNVTSSDADDNTGKNFNLYTQITNRPFEVKIFSYDENNTVLKDVNNSVEIEMFNVGYFGGDINVSCYNPDGNISAPIFINFDDEHVVERDDIEYDRAIRNTGFRIWYLLTPDGNTLENNCLSREDEGCFDTLYANNYAGSDTFCDTECGAGNVGCYPCLRKYYGKPICSRDNFAVRPQSFAIEVIDTNQDSDTTVAQISVGTNKVNSDISLAAGYDYRFDINATNYANDNAVRGYIQNFNQSQNANYAKMTWSPDDISINAFCNDIEDQNISISLFNGSTINGTTAQMHNVGQVGKYGFELEDQNWTAVDWNDGLTIHHTSPDFDTGDDCFLNGTVDLENSGSKQGCYIKSIHTHPNASDQYYALATQYYPYNFTTAGLNVGAGPTSNKAFAYMNTLSNTLYPGGVDEDMSYNIQGTFRASGVGGTSLNNFVTGCYAGDVNLSVDYAILFADTAQGFTTDIQYSNPTTGATMGVHTQPVSTVGVVTALNTLASPRTIVDSSNFQKDANGSVFIDLGYNFDRDTTTVQNPIHIRFFDFNISYTDSPSLTVNGTEDYTIESNLSIDGNVSFYYAKIKPSQTFYDGITDINASTPISIEIYCDLGFVLCAQRGINTNQAQTSDFNWWKSWNHNNTGLEQDGNIAFQATVNSGLNDATPDINIGGENATLILTRNNPVDLPLTVPVILETNSALANFTDRWLLYEGDGNITAPLFRVRFIGGPNWAGHGETGSVVGGGLNTAKSGRVEW